MGSLDLVSMVGLGCAGKWWCWVLLGFEAEYMYLMVWSPGTGTCNINM